MGMFDDITINDPLPVNDEMIALGLDKNVYSYQTKDLECCLDLYFIQGKKLFRKEYKETIWVKGDPKGSSIFDRTGHIERTGDYLQHLPNFHGTIDFYTNINDVNNNLDCWVEYKATFTNGVCEKIELIEFTARDNTERKAQAKKWEDERLITNNIWYNKYFFHTKIWGAIRIKLRSILYKIGSLCYNATSKIP
jgi:hypothetical protein